jgi:hypothetical protein
MMKSRWLSAALILAGLAVHGGLARGQDVTWESFEKKETFYQKLYTKTTQKMTVMGMKNEQVQEQTFYFEWTPLGKEGDDYKVKQKIIGIKMDIDIGGNKISYVSASVDETAKQPKNPMTEFFGNLVGAEFTLYLNPKTQKVTKVEDVDKLVENLTKVNASMKPLLDKILSKESVQQMAEPMLKVVPPEGKFDMAKKTWSSTTELKMGPIGTYVTKNDYEFKGEDKDKGLAKIGVKVDLKYQAPAGNEGGNLPFKIKKADNLQGKQIGDKNEIEFNYKKGRIESSHLEVELKGDLEIEIAGMSTSVNLDQTQVTDLTTTDKNPLPEKKKS